MPKNVCSDDFLSGFLKNKRKKIFWRKNSHVKRFSKDCEKQQKNCKSVVAKGQETIFFFSGHFSAIFAFFPIIILLDCMHSEDASCFRHA